MNSLPGRGGDVHAVPDFEWYTPLMVFGVVERCCESDLRVDTFLAGMRPDSAACRGTVFSLVLKGLAAAVELRGNLAAQTRPP